MMPTQMLEVHWVILYFIYGQVFFIMGLVTGLQWRRRSRLELARSLPWLAGFGLTHGLNEWGYIFIPMQARHLFDAASLQGFDMVSYIFIPLQVQFSLPPLVVAMIAIHLALLGFSFFCLFQFGTELLLPLFPRRWLRAVPGIVLSVWVAALLVRALVTSEPFNVLVAIGDGWSRYFMAFPGAILAHLGLLRQARQVRQAGFPRIAIYLTGAAVGFSVYALVGGLMVPEAPFFPANVFNYDLLNRTIQIPAPVFRSLCGLAIVVFVVRFLEVFEVETDRLIAEMEQRQVLAADRERIGRELHDGIIQNIYSAGLVLEDADHWVTREPGTARQRLRAAMSTLNQTIQDIRAYIFDLQTSEPSRELESVLQKLVSDMRLEGVLNVDLEVVRRDCHQLTPEQTANLTQIVREALRNVVQHAEAHRAVITVDCRQEEVCLTVVDDGRGISPEAITQATHHGRGIMNMQARARLMGGRLELESTPGQGVRLTVTAPYGNGHSRQPAG